MIRAILLEQPSDGYTCASCMCSGIEQNRSLLQVCGPGWRGRWKGTFCLCAVDDGVALLVTSGYRELLCSPVHMDASEPSRRKQIIRALC